MKKTVKKTTRIRCKIKLSKKTVENHYFFSTKKNIVELSTVLK